MKDYAGPADESSAPSARLSIARGNAETPLRNEEWISLTVVLFDRHVTLLDRLVAQIATATGDKTSRSEVVRALIEHLAESGSAMSEMNRAAELLSSWSAAADR